MHWMRLLTDCADQAVMLPLTLVIGLALVAAGWRRGAVVWLLTIGCMLAAMLVLKLWAGQCGGFLFGERLASPSGHTASAAAIYGGGAALLLGRHVPRLLAALLCAGLFAFVMGTSRVLLGAHSLVEVMVGAGVGIAAAMLLAGSAGPVPARLHGLRMSGAILATLLVFHGLHMPAEAAIRKARVTWIPLSLCRAPS